MKLGLLAVLAVAVLVPSLSESRIVSKCDLKEQLSRAIKLPARFEKHRETILERVIYVIYRKSGLNSTLVRVFGKRITTTAKPTTEATTPLTSGGNETTTEEMTGTTDVQPATNQSVTINPMTTNSGNGTNSTDGSRQKREASSELEIADVTGNEEDNTEDNEDEGKGSEEGVEGDEEDEEGNKEEEVGEEEEEGVDLEEVGEEEEEGVDLEEVGEEEEEEGNEEEEEGEEEVDDEEEEEGKEEEEEGVDEEEEEVDEEEEEAMDNDEGGKREKRSFRRRKHKQKRGPRLSLKRKWAVKLRPWSIGFYGIFQLSDSNFCDSGYRWSRNRCQTSCTAFTDDDISDDIACLIKTRRWWYLLRKARWYRPAKGFLKECK